MTTWVWDLLCELFGIDCGTSRWVFKIPFTDKVLKVDKRPNRLASQNDIECFVWYHVKDTFFLKDYFAPIFWCSPGKKYVIQAYAPDVWGDLSQYGYYEDVPDYIRAHQKIMAANMERWFPFLTDIKIGKFSSFGYYKGRIVLRDYGMLIPWYDRNFDPLGELMEMMSCEHAEEYELRVCRHTCSKAYHFTILDSNKSTFFNGTGKELAEFFGDPDNISRETYEKFQSR